MEQQRIITFKRATEHDAQLIYSWFKEPYVAQWWPVPESNEGFLDYFLPRIRSRDTFPFVVYINDIPFGYIQYYYINRTHEKTGGDWLPHGLPEKTTVGIDQFIGDPQYLHKGYGALMIKEFIAYLHQLESHITTIVLDPSPDNIVAIKCYEKVGFKHMGIVNAPWGKAVFMRYDIPQH
jgi:RimJ/RimL family protein N-acetyltransferase